MAPRGRGRGRGRGSGKGGRGTPAQSSKVKNSQNDDVEEEEEEENNEQHEEKSELKVKSNEDALVQSTPIPAVPDDEKLKDDEVEVVVENSINKRKSRSRASLSSTATVSTSKTVKKVEEKLMPEVPTETINREEKEVEMEVVVQEDKNKKNSSSRASSLSAANISATKTVRSKDVITEVLSVTPPIVSVSTTTPASSSSMVTSVLSAPTPEEVPPAVVELGNANEDKQPKRASLTTATRPPVVESSKPAAPGPASAPSIITAPVTAASGAGISTTKSSNINKKFPPHFDASYIHKVYAEHVQPNDLSKLRQLELSGYLESYLWPLYQEGCVSEELTISMMVMINEKCRDGSSSSSAVWSRLLSTINSTTNTSVAAAGGGEGANTSASVSKESVNKFELFMTRVIELSHSFRPSSHTTAGGIALIPAAGGSAHATTAASPSSSSPTHLLNLQIQYTTFFIHVFQSLDIPVVRKFILRYLSLELWVHLSETRRVEECSRQPALSKHWNYLVKMKLVTSENECQLDTTASASAAIHTEGVTSTTVIDTTDVSATATGKTKGRKASSSSVSVSASKTAKKLKTTHDTTTASTAPTAINTKDISDWFNSLLHLFLNNLEHFHITNTAEEEEGPSSHTSAPSSSSSVYSNKMLSMIYFEKFMEWLIDLLSQLPTRRFLNTLLDDVHLLVRIKRSPLYAFLTSSGGAARRDNDMVDAIYQRKLFINLVYQLELYLTFEVNDQTGVALLPHDLVEQSSTQVTRLQSIAFHKHPIILKDLIYASLGSLVSNKDTLENYLNLLSVSDVAEMAKAMKYVSVKDLQPYIRNESDALSYDEQLREYLYAIIEYKLMKRPSQLDQLNRLSLYPTEELLWDEHAIPSSQKFRSSDHGTCVSVSVCT